MSESGSSDSNGGQNFKFLQPIESGVVGSSVGIQSNLYAVQFTDSRNFSFFRYDVTIYATGLDVEDIKDPSVKPIFITKKTGNDVRSLERKTMSRDAVNLVLDKNPGLAEDRSTVFYDGQAMLLSRRKLHIQDIEFESALKTADLAGSSLAKHFKIVAVVIKPCASSFENTLSGVMRGDGTVRGPKYDRPIQQYLDIVTSIPSLQDPARFLHYDNGKIYLNDGDEFSIPAQEIPTLPDGKHLKLGLQKTALFVQGPLRTETRAQRVAFVIAVDARKCAFHTNKTCAQKATEVLKGFTFERPPTEQQLQLLNDAFTDLKVIPLTAPDRVFVVKRVKGDAHIRFSYKGEPISVVNYYKQRHNITLAAPFAPLLVVRGEKETFFPLEACMVAPGQRVTMSQQTAEQMAATTKECAMLPHRRQAMITQCARALNLLGTERQDQDGFYIMNKLLKLEGRMIGAPKIVYGQNQPACVNVDTFTWKNPDVYLIPSVVGKWAFICITDEDKGAFVFDSKSFAERLVREATNRGVAVELPSHYEIMIDPAEISTTVEKIHKQGFVFLMTVTEDRLSVQDDIKYAERRYEVLTQNIRLKTARDVLEQGKPATVENIVNKLNVKHGGVNYSIKLNGERLLADCNTLVIGICMGPPSGFVTTGSAGASVRTPTVVGYAANICENVETFTGDYEVFDFKASEQIGLVGMQIVSSALDRWALLERDDPDRLFVYRSDVPDGEYERLAKVEVAAIKEFISKRGKKNMQLTYMVVSTDTTVRLFKSPVDPKTNAIQQNITPGVVVDHTVTSPHMRQFYLNSHVTLQGTARTPRYTILHDDLKHTMDEIQRFTCDLCYMHQIVNLPTSLPTPLYVAKECANRARRMVNFDISGEHGSQPYNVDSESMRKRLLYKNCNALRNIRYNA